MKHCKALLTAVALTLAMATPGLAQEGQSSLPSPASEVCGGCLAYLVFPPSPASEAILGLHDPQRMGQSASAGRDVALAEPAADPLASLKQ